MCKFCDNFDFARIGIDYDVFDNRIKPFVYHAGGSGNSREDQRFWFCPACGKALLSQIPDPLPSDVAHRIEIQKADAEGRLLVLPCKPGATVFKVSYDSSECFECDAFSHCFGSDQLCEKNYDLFPVPGVTHTDDDGVPLAVCPKHLLYYVPHVFDPAQDLTEIGKTIFLNEAEAKAMAREGAVE